MKIEFWHEEVANVDLSNIMDGLTDEEFSEFYDCYLQTIQKAKKQPFRPGWDLISEYYHHRHIARLFPRWFFREWGDE